MDSNGFRRSGGVSLSLSVFCQIFNNFVFLNYKYWIVMSENNDFFPQVMQRYAIHPPMSNSDVNPQFMTALLRAFEEKPFCPGDFDTFPIELIVDYIKRTHVYYLQKKLPEIEQSILL